MPNEDKMLHKLAKLTKLILKTFICFSLFFLILLLASIIILNEHFSLFAQQKRETEKQMKDNINEATTH